MPPILVNRARFPDRGRCENPFAAVAGVKSLGEVISTDFEVARLKTVNFKPKSEKIQTSSSFPPNEIKVVFVVPEVGLVILAEKRSSLGENMRMTSADATSRRLEEHDHINEVIEAVSSGGSDMERIISRERVSLS